MISRKMTRQKKQEDQAEETRQEIGKGNQMTALRFQTGGQHQTQIFEELVPSILPLLKENIILGHDGITDHSV